MPTPLKSIGLFQNPTSCKIDRLIVEFPSNWKTLYRWIPTTFNRRILIYPSIIAPTLVQCRQFCWKLIKGVTLGQRKNEKWANVSHVMLGQCHTVNGIFTSYTSIQRWANVRSMFVYMVKHWANIGPTWHATPISTSFHPTYYNGSTSEYGRLHLR